MGGLSGVGEWKGWGGPVSQAAVDARWKEIGQPPPAPIVPAALIGTTMKAGKAGFFFVKDGKMIKPSKEEGKKIAQFRNFWWKVAVDPYRKQSGISKVAGGILKVASVAFPVLGVANAVATAGNMALQANAAKDFDKTVDAVMTPAFEANALLEKQKADTALAAQISALQALRPTSNAAPVGIVATSTGAKSGWTSAEKIAAGAVALVAVLALLGVRK